MSRINPTVILGSVVVARSGDLMLIREVWPMSNALYLQYLTDIHTLNLNLGAATSLTLIWSVDSSATKRKIASDFLSEQNVKTGHAAALVDSTLLHGATVALAAPDHS